MTKKVAAILPRLSKKVFLAMAVLLVVGLALFGSKRISFLSQIALTKGWTTHTLSKINLEFKLPPEFDQLGRLNEGVVAGEKGEVYCAAFSPKTSFLIRNVYAGGIGCNVSSFGIGAASKDFEVGRSIFFTDYRGYTIKNGSYWTGLGEDWQAEIRKDLVKEMTNPYGVKILRVVGQDKDNSPFPVAGTPGEGWVGAIINLPNGANYPGAIVQMKLTDIYTLELFDKVLSTFKFIRATNEGTRNWSVFQNKEMGFEIKYPQTFTASYAGGVGDYASATFTDSKVGVVISSNSMYPNKNLEAQECNNPVFSEEITVDGAKGRICQDSTSKVGLYIKHGKFHWNFLLTTPTGNEKEEIATFKKMLSTFKFLK